MKILAIDPGYGRIGFAVLKKTQEKPELLHSECFETDKKTPYEKRLKSVGERLRYLIKKHQPDCVVVERLFFSKNKKTAMHVAEVRGLLLYEAQLGGIETVEYTPNQIKNAVTGSGIGDKKQIMRMVPKLINIDTKKDRNDDEYDAIAVGITHLATIRKTCVS